jgi:hypothetical protein
VVGDRLSDILQRTGQLCCVSQDNPAIVMVDGMKCQLTCVLERTAVVGFPGDRRVVRHDAVTVPASQLAALALMDPGDPLAVARQRGWKASARRRVVPKREVAI